MTGIGPQLPPHLMKLSKNEQEEKSLESASETNIYGPALPPHLQKRIEKEEPATGKYFVALNFCFKVNQSN